MNELALFAGNGGGILASKLLGWTTVCAVEYDQYCSQRLMQRQNEGHIPPFPIWDDVHTFDGKPWRNVIDVVSGGFPCQAFSTASRGRRVAKNLWPEMLRIVREIMPPIVFAENVQEQAINTACDELESLGYKTRAISLSAQDMGADHSRGRFWLVAHTDDEGELLCRQHAEMAMLKKLQNSFWKSSPMESRMDDGLANRVERLKATGNGQVPIVAAAAFCMMAETI